MNLNLKSIVKRSMYRHPAATRALSFFRQKLPPNPAENAPLTAEQKDKLRDVISEIRPADEPRQTSAVQTHSGVENEMDSIRARGFLKYRYNYSPPTDLHKTVEAIALENGVQDVFQEMSAKEAVLKQIGNTLKHFVPNSRLHEIKSVADLVAFYSEPVRNITRYAEMARDEGLPTNIAIMEHPQRFHPNDLSAPHGGVTAFPGEGGEVFSIRQKRLLRQYRPKRDWFDYEERSFDYERIDKDMPWDPQMARKMDRHAKKQFLVKQLRKN